MTDSSIAAMISSLVTNVEQREDQKKTEKWREICESGKGE